MVRLVSRNNTTTTTTTTTTNTTTNNTNNNNTTTTTINTTNTNTTITKKTHSQTGVAVVVLLLLWWWDLLFDWLVSPWGINPFRTAVPFRREISWNLRGSFPKRDSAVDAESFFFRNFLEFEWFVPETGQQFTPKGWHFF